MRHKKILFITLLGLLIIPDIMLCAQQTSDMKQEIITKLNSKNEDKILDAYWLLTKDGGFLRPEYRDDAEIRNSLWNALTFLVPKPAIVKTPESEGNSAADYLLYIMGDVRETRAIPYLMANIDVGGFQDSLARMGDEAVPLVLNMLESGKVPETGIAVGIFETMLDPKPKEMELGNINPVTGLHKVIPNPSYGLYTPSGKVRTKIKLALQKQIKINPLSGGLLSTYKYVADENDIKFYEDISKNNAYKVRKLKHIRHQHGTPLPVEPVEYEYPFREEAQKALDYIKANSANSQSSPETVQKTTSTP